MEHTKLYNIPGILLLLAFRKGFDTIEWPSIQNTLNFLNFGDGIKRWISTFYTGLESAVLNNGFSTNYFQLSRGVRQLNRVKAWLSIIRQPPAKNLVWCIFLVSNDFLFSFIGD